MGCIMAELLQGKALFPGNDCILGEQGQAGVPFSRVGVDSGPFWKFYLCPMPNHIGLPLLSHSSSVYQGLGLETLATRCFLS